VRKILDALPRSEVDAAIEARLAERNADGLLKLIESYRPSPEDPDPLPEVDPLKTNEQKAVSKYFAQQYQLAAADLASGDYLEARRRVDACLTLITEPRLRDLFRTLSLEIAREMTRHEAVAGLLRTDRRVYFRGDEVVFSFVLENRADEKATIEFPADADDVQRGPIIISMTVADVNAIGQELSAEHGDVLTFDGPVVLEPGGSRAFEYSFDTSKVDPEFKDVRMYTLSGTLTPTKMIIGEREFERVKFDFPTRTALLLPESAKTFSGNPLARLAGMMDSFASCLSFTRDNPEVRIETLDQFEALKKQAADDPGGPLKDLPETLPPSMGDLFLCGMQIPDRDGDAALDLLMPALEETHGPAAQTLVYLIRRFADDDVGLSREAWLQWWKETQQGPGIVPDPGE
jgi:hypothetical protein